MVKSVQNTSIEKEIFAKRRTAWIDLFINIAVSLFLLVMSVELVRRMIVTGNMGISYFIGLFALTAIIVLVILPKILRDYSAIKGKPMVVMTQKELLVFDSIRNKYVHIPWDNIQKVQLRISSGQKEIKIKRAAGSSVWIFSDDLEYDSFELIQEIQDSSEQALLASPSADRQPDNRNPR